MTRHSLEEIAKATSKAETDANAHLVSEGMQKEKTGGGQAGAAEPEVASVAEEVDMMNYILVNDVVKGDGSEDVSQFVTPFRIRGRSYHLYLDVRGEQLDAPGSI